MLEVQKVYSSHLLLPLPEGRSWYPKQDFSLCQIQSPPHHLDNRLCNLLTTSHWPPEALEVSPLCLQMESVYSTLWRWQVTLLVRWCMGGSQSWTEVITLIVNSAERQEKPRISKERGGSSQHSQIPSTLVGEAYPWPYDYICSSKPKPGREQVWVISHDHIYINSK